MGQSTRLGTFDATGAGPWELDILDQYPSIGPAPAALGLPAEAVLVSTEDLLESFDGSGASAWARALPPEIACPYAGLQTLDSRARLLARCGTTVTRFGSDAADTTPEYGPVDFAVDGRATHASRPAVDGNDDLLIAGWFEPDREPVAGRTNQAPFVAKLGADGALQWIFRETAPVTGSPNSLAVDANDNVYLLSTEDPVTYAYPLDASREGLCTIYGCDGIVLRKLSPDGELLWSYEHRSARSYARDLALDSQGRAVVAGEIHRENEAGLLLRFPP